MNHFIDINQLNEQQLRQLINQAGYFKSHAAEPMLQQAFLANLFFEPST